MENKIRIKINNPKDLGNNKDVNSNNTFLNNLEHRLNNNSKIKKSPLIKHIIIDVSPIHIINNFILE